MKKHINTEYVRVRVGLLGLGDGLGLGYGRGLVRGEQVSDGEFRGKCSGGQCPIFARTAAAVDKAARMTVPCNSMKRACRPG